MYTLRRQDILNVGEWLPSRSGRFTSGEIFSSSNWTGGTVGHRVGLEAVEKRNSPVLGIESQTQPTATEGRASPHNMATPL
jgi:hypothetical protein